MAYSMSDLLQLVVSEGASDLHIRVGVPPTIRVHGILHRLEGPPCRPEDAEEIVSSACSLAFDSDQAIAILISQRMLGRKKWTETR